MKPYVLSLLLFVTLVSARPVPAKQTQPSWTEQTIESLTLREKIGQLIQIRVPGKFLNRQSPEFQALREQISQNKVGGLVLFAGDIYESAILLNELQSASSVPLIVTADFERGASFRISDTTSFPWTMALGATGSEEFAYQQGLITAQESRALGVHWIFAPVTDVNNNPDNPVINIRSFGEDPALVARLGAAFIRGARKGGVLTTAKHFPGHGDTSTDSHIGLAVVTSDAKRLAEIEFVPFRSAIEAGVDSIMTAHVAVPELTGAEELPATLSKEILTGVLRERLKFDGLIVTDALEMGAVTNSYWSGLAAVRAVQAGADVLLLPTDAAVAVNEVERAVRRGDIPESRIDESVRRILAAKQKLGLHLTRTVPISRIADTISLPESRKVAQEIADRSITVVKDERRLLPVDPLGSKRIFSVVLASDQESSPASVFQAEMRRRFSSVRTEWANSVTSAELLSRIDKFLADSDVIVCSTLARLSSGRDTAAISGTQQSIIQKLIASGKPLIWVSFGSPYVLRLAPKAGTYVCTFSYSDVSQVAAAKAISGEIPISGRMPVSIPGHSAIGAGIQIPKLNMTLKTPPGETPGFEKAKELLRTFVKSGLFQASEILLLKENEVRLRFSTSGEMLHDAGALKKHVETASAVMLAIDGGMLPAAAPVRDYLPELKDRNAGRSVRDLLASVTQSDEAKALIDRIVNRAAGIPAEKLAADRLFQPLGMREAAGTTAMDFAVFAQMLLNRGVYDHRRYFSAGVLTRYTGRLWSKPAVPELFAPNAFGYSAKTGSFLWIDPGRRLSVIMIANGAQAKSEKAVAEAQRQVLQTLLGSRLGAPASGRLF